MGMFFVIAGVLTTAFVLFHVAYWMADAFWLATTYTWMVIRTHRWKWRDILRFFLHELLSRLFTWIGSSTTEVSIGDYSCQYPFGWVRRRK